jgi:hypothetical protein
MTPKDWGSERWRHELGAHFFSPASAGEPVLYAVDRDVLSSITGESGAASAEMPCAAR